MIKRLIDIIFSLLGLIILLPLFLIIAVLIKIDSRGPVFFKQERLGKNGNIFKVFKFRTMVEGAEKKGLGYSVVENDYRITKLGKFLRKWSLDEFPQLINVSKGEMSLVGPRPALPTHLERYSDYQKKRLNVKPGITGYAQIKGRASLPWPKRIEYDIYYINNQSLLLDFKILFFTFFMIFKSKNIYNKNGEAWK